MPQAERERGTGRDRPVGPRGDVEEAAPRLDRAVLDANTMSDRRLQAEIFRLYFDQAPVYFSHMRRGVEERNETVWAAGCHGLKGTARTLGLSALATVAAAAENAAPSLDWYDAVEARMSEAQAAAHLYLAEV